jgi:hypothetical protein
MLELKDQVCYSEVAKRLENLGVKQNSYFYYVDFPGHENKPLPIDLVKCYSENVKRYSAFNVAELGEILPVRLSGDNIKYWYATGKTYKDDPYYPEHEVSYGTEEETFYLTRDNNESDARAKMLIHLIENNLVSEEWRQKWLVNNG